MSFKFPCLYLKVDSLEPNLDHPMTLRHPYGLFASNHLINRLPEIYRRGNKHGYHGRNSRYPVTWHFGQDHYWHAGFPA